jgi:serine/threonine-protein kinase
MALEVGQRVGDYEVQALLGAGGMGRVYKVRNIISNREEAMKVLLPDFASEPELAARFMAEIRTLAGLDHPNIAQLRTAFQFQKEFVMIMEFVEGTTLETLASHSAIPLDQVLEYSTQVLSALSFAHGRGVTHRDIKPANIMVTSHGLVKLMDFGIAKSADDMQLTRPGTTMGSVYYISPEQVSGGTVDARSDIYSFGVTLYEMLTGRKPFQADTSYSVLYAQMNEKPTPPVEVNPAVPPKLNDIVLMAMQKNPELRFQTADAFRNAIKSLRQPPAAQPVPQPLGFAAVDLSASAVMPQQQGFSPVAAASSASAPQPQAYAPVAPPVPAAAQPQQEFAPVGPVPVAAAPSANKSHRGLWIGLGALAAILALVAAATVLPRVYATFASQKASVAATPTPAAAPSTDSASAAPQNPSQSGDATQPASTGATTTEAAPATSTTATPAATTPAPPSQTVVNKPHRTDASPGSSQAAQPATTASSSPAVPAGPSRQEIRQAHDRLMSLEARADAARSGVQQIRSQQQAQGLDIRGDILSAMSRMNNSLGEANRALNQNDLQAADEYMERADKEASRLESFLGR